MEARLFCKSKFLYFYYAVKSNPVNKRISISTQTFRKAMLLMGVYVMHLVFFQALMQAAPTYNVDNSFKPLFIHKCSHVNHNIPAARHPAVTYYSIMVKQGNDVGGSCNQVTPFVTELIAVVTPSILSRTFHICQTSIGQLHWADDIFKVYRLIGVFLI